MSLQPKLTVLAQDTATYGALTVQDTTGAYNASTNPGGYGAPNPATGDVVVTYLREEYMGDTAPGAWEEINTAQIQGAGATWDHDFREGVARIAYLVCVPIAGGGITGLKGNITFTLSNAHTKLANATHIQIGGKLYPLNATKLTSLGGEVLVAFEEDYINTTGNAGFEGGTYTLWNTQGYTQLVKDIAAVGCSTLNCDREEVVQLMSRYRWYKAAIFNFELGNYSRAHNLSVLLTPELNTSNCASC